MVVESDALLSLTPDPGTLTLAAITIMLTNFPSSLSIRAAVLRFTRCHYERGEERSSLHQWIYQFLTSNTLRAFIKAIWSGTARFLESQPHSFPSSKHTFVRSVNKTNCEFCYCSLPLGLYYTRWHEEFVCIDFRFC